MVTKQVERDRVEPGFLTCTSATVERLLGAQDAHERFGQDVFGKRAVAAPVDQKAEKRLGVLRVETLELSIPHELMISDQESAVSFV
jgi:hypothetical protein